MTDRTITIDTTLREVSAQLRIQLDAIEKYIAKGSRLSETFRHLYLAQADIENALNRVGLAMKAECSTETERIIELEHAQLPEPASLTEQSFKIAHTRAQSRG